MTGKITDVSKTLQGRFKVTITLDFAEEEVIDDLINRERLTIEMKPYHPKRSLDANSYCWTLINKLAVKLQITKEEVYRHFIRDVGDNSTSVCMLNKCADKFCEIWSSKGTGWLTDRVTSLIPGCTTVTAYYGSSTYDTAQMSRLIQLVVDECKTQGIETATPEELSLMVERWKQ